MVNGLWGKKIGMTQVFSDRGVVPATIIDLAHWYVTQIKSQEKDGYNALQIGLVRSRFNDKEFSPEWIKKPSKYFYFLKEVAITGTDSEKSFTVGQKIDPKELFNKGDAVDAFGITKGCGFQGVVKRYGWSGGKASHGSKFGRLPGSLGGARESGKVIKGKGLPGHMGASQRAVLNLEIVDLLDASPIVVVKGSVPGKAGTLIFLRKRG